jgi:uncharacterized membrane protein
MIRSLLVSLFFFFGPALLMFMLRNLTLLLLLWARNRQRRVREQEIIDITPVRKGRAPAWFYAVVIIISLTSAVTVFTQLQHGDVEQQQYVPAHVDKSGNIVSGDWEPKAPAP